MAVRVGDEIRDLARPLERRATPSRSSPRRAATTTSTSCATRPRTSWPRRSRASSPAPSSAFGPPIEDGFYYDFDAAAAAHRGGLPGHRGRDGADHRGEGALPAQRDERSTTRARVLRRARRPLQGRPDRRARPPGRGVGARSTATRDFVDLCRGPHVPGHGPDRRGQAAVASPAPTGAATSRTRSSRASTPPPSPPRRSWTRTSTALEEARARDHRAPRRASSSSSTSTTPGPASRSSCPTGWSWSTASRTPCATSSRALGYEEIQTPTMLSDELWQPQRPLGPLPRQHVLHRRRGARASRSSR